MKKIIKIGMMFLIILGFIMIIKPIRANTVNTTGYIDSEYKEDITTNTLNIRGWVMSKEPNIKIKVSIDNNFFQEIVRNEARPDVLNTIKGYGSKVENPLPGFNTNIDISTIKEGKHIIKIEAIQKSTEQLVYQEKITFKKSDARMYIDNPIEKELVSKELTIRGWVMSDNPIQIKAYINNQFIKVLERNEKRPDVLNAIKGYGGVQKNLIPGFNDTIDVSDYKAGNYILKIETINTNTKSIIEENEVTFVKQYAKTTGDIDTVYSTRIAQNTLPIRGWIMSEVPNTKIKVYIEDQFFQELKRNEERIDVLNTIKGYGSKVENPLPGFNTDLDISHLKEGKHNLKIKVILSDTDEIVYSMETSFYKEEAKIDLDRPTNGEKVVNQLPIRGWVMTDAKIQIKAYINNQFIKVLERNEKRPDVLNVIKGYGGATKNPLPGFQDSLDVSSFKYGINTLKLEIINTTTFNKIKEIEQKFEIRKPNTRMYIDNPVSKEFVIGENLRINGWAMSETDIKVKVLIDNACIQEIVCNKERPDVLQAIKDCGTKDQNPKPGFETNIDMSSYKDGKHTIKLVVVSTKTGDTLQEEIQEINLKKYNSKSDIDEPIYSSTQNANVILRGWLLSECQNVQINIYINNKKVDASIERQKREDVLNTIKGYGGITLNPLPGYRTLIDMSNYKDGTYILKVEAVDTKNNEILVTQTTDIKLVKYATIIKIEEPNLATINEEKLTISGWVLSKCKNTTLNVYIDNTKIEIQRLIRNDVFTDSNIQSFGGADINKTPGFNATIDFTNYAKGEHNIKVVLVNNDLKEDIAVVTKNILKYSNIKLGIDVSTFQKQIDWKAVSKTGVNFAMIRAGFRGYGVSSDGINGKLVVDDYFKTNIEGAIKNNIEVGVYFFTQAINEQEAVEEANFVLQLIKNYKITYPIAIDTELSSHPQGKGRADNLSIEQRSKVIKVFCDTIEKAGYEPMIYAGKDWLKNKLDMNKLSNYSVWLAHYTGATQDNPLEKPSDYEGDYIMWQYTDKGTLNGILGNTDMNIEYRSVSKKIKIMY